ncbi:hypothetical protein BJ741DRAFT_91121 [Chytriomyces cf. hyalinus JEL632]|nr:hypothetical protein BJ741DRAFT_91121 [Chytriomyces cf. hyalinus JEL632]
MNDLDSSAAFVTADTGNLRSASSSLRGILQVNADSGIVSDPPEGAQTVFPTSSATSTGMMIRSSNSEHEQFVTSEDSGASLGASEVVPTQVSDSQPADAAIIPNSTNLASNVQHSAFTSSISVGSKLVNGGIDLPPVSYSILYVIVGIVTFVAVYMVAWNCFTLARSKSLKPDIERSAAPQRMSYRRNGRAEIHAVEQELSRECRRPLSFCVDTPEIIELQITRI